MKKKVISAALAGTLAVSLLSARKPGAEKISKFYLLSDTKKRTPERMCFLSSARFFLILLFLPSRFYRRG